MTETPDFDPFYEYFSYQIEQAREYAKDMSNSDLLSAILYEGNLYEVRLIFKECLLERICIN